MTTRREQNIVRIIAVLLMAALSVVTVAASWRAEMLSIKTTLLPFEATPSDDEMVSRANYDAVGYDVLDILDASEKKYDIDRGFLDFCIGDEHINADGSLSAALRRYLDQSGYSDSMWETLTGYTFSVLYDLYNGNLDSPDVTVLGDVYAQHKTTLSFTGDVNLSYDWYNMQHFRAKGSRIENVISADLLEMMRSADLLFVNNEFSVSRRGTPLKGKTYTFRANPDDLSIYDDMGVDIVSLANNHVYDYGRDAFADTLSHLDEAGILRIGAGMNETEASAVRYIISGGMKIALCAASSAEMNRYTPVADGDTAGVMGLYETESFCRVIEEAKSKSDLVIAYVHFGIEKTNELADSQIAAAHDIVDAGADIVIGAHPHVLQPVEYYNGRPIVYSLGNFWFNAATADTAILTVSTSVGIRPILRFYPCIHKGGETYFAKGDNGARIINMMNSWSSTADIGEDNRIRER